MQRITGEVNAIEVALVELTGRVKALEEKTHSYSWFLRVLLSALVLSVLGLLAIHVTWK